MKYFTLDRWIQDQQLDTDNNDLDDSLQRYQVYLKDVIDRLPADFVLMSKTICIHDATLPELTVDIPNRRLTMKLDAGDFTMTEGRMIKLHYLEVTDFSSTSDANKGLPGPHGFGELGNDEIELLEDGLYEHRLLFSSGIELAVRFRNFRLEVL